MLIGKEGPDLIQTLQETYPLSPLQHGMLFQALLAPASGVNLQQILCRFHEDIDPQRLRLAWLLVAQRHKVLRTRFRWVDLQDPVQEVIPQVRLEIVHCDLAGLALSAQELQLQRHLEEDRIRGFDLAEAPAMRLALFRYSAGEHVMVFTAHHILLDGQSFVAVLREVLARYDADLDGIELSFPSPVPFRDHIVWLRGRDAAADETFWTSHLGGMGALAPLSGSRHAPRNPEQEPLHARREIQLSWEEDAALRAFKSPYYLNILAQGAWALLLGHWTGQEEAVFGMVRGGRATGVNGADGMIGLLINTVPVRVPLPAQEKVGVWLKQIAKENRRLLLHEHAALPDIARWSGLPQGAPLFNTLFNYQTALIEQAFREMGDRWAGRSVRLLQRTGYPLTVGVSGTAPLLVRIDYDADCFDAITIDAILYQYRRLLLAMVSEPATPLSYLPLISPEERQELLCAGRATSRFSVSQPIHARFEQRAAERPHSPALTFGETTLSYGELNACANRLARRLRALGVGQEARVGIALERSAELVIAILAVLKAGGAYVPLDPSYPAERISFVLEDAGIPVLVTTSGLLPRLPTFEGTTLCVEAEEAEAIRLEVGENPTCEVGPDHLAYVIYTSGSTGTPKGVQVTHANVVRLFDATEAWFGFTAEDVWTLFHSCAFDFSVWEIWGALLYGGRLVVVPFLTTRSPEDFHRLLVHEGVTVLSQTPSAFKQLVQADQISSVAPSALPLRYVVFGGEALDPQALRPWIERHGDERPRLVNMYGITETTVHVTYRTITRADLRLSGSPIGSPIPDLSLHLLDRNLEPVPLGVPGEIFVGGPGVARGYLNRPELTAERFVRDTFAAKPGARLYRSGDLARRRSDGELEYLGRADDQVKVRGFRIELGEIEAVLGSHPVVGSAAVIVREDTPGDKRLAAYVVPLPGIAQPTPAELRTHAAAALPDYMVPPVFVLLEKLPLTVNGKLDRRALPTPEVGRALLPAYEAPASESERLLQDVWQEVLGLERVGVQESFFAAGGDSLRSVQLVAVLRERGMALTVHDLYQQPTIRGLAERIGSMTVEPRGTEGLDGGVPHHLADLPEEEWSRARALFGEELEDLYPAARMQALMLFEYAKDTARDGIYHAQQCHRLTDTSLSVAALRYAIEQLVRRYPILRTAFTKGSDGALLQVVRRNPFLPIEYQDLRWLSPEEQEHAVKTRRMGDLDTPFDPYDPTVSLIRFVIFHRQDDVADLLISAHHAIEDGWGNVHFLNTLFEAYAEARDGRPVSCAPAPNTYREFVALEAEILASREAQTFWQDRFQQACPSWPVRRGGTGGAQSECRVVHQISPTLTAALREAASREGVALKAMYLSPFLDLVATLSGGEGACTGVVWNGRSERLTNPLTALGLFWNLLPVARPSSTLGGAEARVRALHEGLVQADLFGHYPLAEILMANGGREPFFATFNFLHFRNWAGPDAVRGGRVDLLYVFDRFHLPFNLAVNLAPQSEGGGLHVEYDDRFFSRADVADSLDAYLVRLGELARCQE